MRVLLVKISSMGDLIHALPAITDANQHVPNLTMDWLIEESFSEVASWHPAIDKIICSAHRRWRKNLPKTIFCGEFLRFAKNVREYKYDMIIDGQTNHKSAMASLLARGHRVGLDKYSSREYIAHFAYQTTYNVSRKQHAIEVLRSFFAKAFGYKKPVTPPDFSIDLHRLGSLSINTPEEYYVFIHTASWKTKLWPESYFQKLIQMVRLPVFLPWGSKKEHERAKRIAKGQKNAIILPKLTLSQIALLLSKAKGAVCVDTGLGHLSAALGTPSISVYGPTNPYLIGAVGKSQTHLCSDFSCAPCNKARCTYKKPSETTPACFSKLPPEIVYDALLKSVSQSKHQEKEESLATRKSLQPLPKEVD